MQHTPEKPAPIASSERRHWGVTLLWLAPALLLLAFVAYGVLTRPPAALDDTTPRVGQPLSDFTLPDLQGTMVHLEALRGKVVFINIWATWCPPCVEEMPTMQRLYDRLHARGLEVLAISIDPLGAQVVGPFMQQYRLTFPALLDPAGSIERLYRTGGVPESFIVDKRGLLVEKVVGPRDWSHPRMIAMFDRLLATSEAAPVGSR
ncbi:MAG: TlpA disulfide reductase family protein [Candidatus Tectomicrobia bacterium]